jgi:MYXO-CTERM domain-containing protein
LALAAGAIFTAGSARADVFYGVTATSLVRFDMGAHTVSTVGAIPSAMEDCDFDASGTLWGVRTGNIGGFPPTTVCQSYTIDTSTAASTLQANFGSVGNPTVTLESLAFVAGPSTFYSISDSGTGLAGHLQLATMPSGGISNVSGSTHGLPGSNRVDALAIDPISGSLFGVWNSNPGGPFGSSIYDLVRFDTSTGLGTVIGPITGTTAQAFASLRFDSAGIAYTVNMGNGDVYTVNTATGAGTFLFAGGSAAVNTKGLAHVVPAPGATALLGLGLLGVTRRRRNSRAS